MGTSAAPAAVSTTLVLPTPKPHAARGPPHATPRLPTPPPPRHATPLSRTAWPGWPGIGSSALGGGGGGGAASHSHPGAGCGLGSDCLRLAQDDPSRIMIVGGIMMRGPPARRRRHSAVSAAVTAALRWLFAQRGGPARATRGLSNSVRSCRRHAFSPCLSGSVASPLPVPLTNRTKHRRALCLRVRDSLPLRFPSSCHPPPLLPPSLLSAAGLGSVECS